MLRTLADKYRRHLLDSVMPFWMRHSLDPEHGGFFTCLDRDGALYDSRKYVWLNGRQTWMLSKLHAELEPRPDWLAAARSGAEFLRRYAFDPQGRCYFSLARDGAPAFYQRKPYSAVFVALGFAGYARASGDESYQRQAEDLYFRIKGWIADPAPLGRPALAGAPAYGQLADIYVLCSLALELGLHDELPACLADIRRHHDPATGLLLEMAGDRAFPEGRLVCAGSIFEISWFLLRALELHPDPALQQLLLNALANALDFAWDREYGGFYYFQDIEGRPMLQLESQMKLWWVHAEALYALVHAYWLTRDPQWLPWLRRVDDYIFTHFADPIHGEWFGYLDRQGNVSHTLKGNNYKGCFHIPRALLFSVQKLDAAASQRKS
jgi:N-acylglucosamine 2-epimerase